MVSPLDGLGLAVDWMEREVTARRPLGIALGNAAPDFPLYD